MLLSDWPRLLFWVGLPCSSEVHGCFQINHQSGILLHKVWMRLYWGPQSSFLEKQLFLSMVSYSLKDDCKLRQPYLATLQDRLREQAANSSPFSLLLSFPLLRDRKPREYIPLPRSARLGTRGTGRQLDGFTADAAPSSFHSIHLNSH